MRKLLLASILVLGACASTSPPPPIATLTDACSAYTGALNVLSAARAQGRLTPDQVAQIDKANDLALPICTSTTPPTTGTDAITALNAQLEAIIFASGAMNESK